MHWGIVTYRIMILRFAMKERSQNTSVADDVKSNFLRLGLFYNEKAR